MRVTPSIAFVFTLILHHEVVGQDIEYKKNNLPDFNFCVYSLEPLRVLVHCFLGRLPQEFAAEFTSTVQEVFGGLEVAECLKLVCKNNNDDGQMLLNTWVAELEEQYTQHARVAVWDCITKHKTLVESAS